MARSKKDEAEPADEEEYEVESVLSDRRNRSKKLEYLVSWVGYGPAENTWLPETELEGCLDLLTEYWNKKANSKKPAKRKSSGSTSAATKRSRTSASAAALGHDAPGQQDSSEEDEIEEEDVNSEKSREMLAQYSHPGVDWEEQLKDIITVERDTEGTLKFFVQWKDNNRMWVASELLYQRGPQRVIKFFEAHLKFKKPANN